MIFRRRKNASPEEPAEEPVQQAEAEATADGSDPSQATPDEQVTDLSSTEDASTEDASTEDATTEDATTEDATEIDVEELDSSEWRGAGPYDVSEVDLEEDPPEGLPRIDLGSIIVTGFPGAELRLQVDEATQTIVSAMLAFEDSALEIGAYAGPRTGGYWPELREDLVEATHEAGGSTQLTEGPFGVELRRIIPVTTPAGEEGYQPSRMWVVEGPRWLLRGIVYGQAALSEGVEPPVSQFLTAFRSVVVRRGDQPMGPGDLMALQLPEDMVPDSAEPPG